MKLVAVVLPAVLATAALLAGCDPIDKRPRLDVRPAAMNSPEIESPAVTKLDLYTQGWQALTSPPGGGRQPVPLSVRPVGTAKASDNTLIAFSTEREKGWTLLEKGLSLAGGDMSDLDAAVQEVVTLNRNRKNSRNESAPYAANRWSRHDLTGTQPAAYSVIQADHEAMLDALDRVETLLFRYRKIAAEKRMALFEKQNDRLAYHTEESLLNAGDLLALFSHADRAVADPDTYVRADATLASLEASLALQRKAFEEARENGIHPVRDYPEINRTLTSFIGNYRDLRQHRTVSDLNAMIKKYNDALVIHRRASRFAS